MKKYYLLLLFVTSFVSAQIVNIPDANFKAKLLEASSLNNIAKDFNWNSITIDTNSDGEIQLSEAEMVGGLFFSSPFGINDFTGVNSFTNLINFESLNNNASINIDGLLNLETIYFRYSYSTLPSVFTNLPSLKNVYYEYNSLNSLTFNNCPNVEILSTQYSPNLGALTLNNMPALQKLNSKNCNILNLSISNSPVLEDLNMYSNTNLSSLIIGNSPLLKKVDLRYNNLTDISGFSINLGSVEELDLSGNIITNLILPSSMPNLKIIGFNGTNINNLNFANSPNLKSVTIGSGSMTELDVTNKPFLTSLFVVDNPISAISFNNTPSISNLTILLCPIISLNFSNLSQLINVSCTGLLVSELDFSHNPLVSSVRFHDNQNLTNINFKSGVTNTINYNISSFFNVPNLAYICIDEGDVINYSILQTPPSIPTSSYCSFTPGGNYNAITGSMLYDANSNGCDASDLPQPNIKININDGTNQGATFTNNLGNYSFFTQTGNFSLTPNVENPSWFNFSPTSATIPFANNNDNVVNQNFCITANGIHPDLEIVIVPIIPARPGFDAVYKIVYKNKGNQVVTGTINFTYNESVLDFVSSSLVPNNSGSGFMNWTVPNIAPFQSGSILVTFNVNSPQETPAVNIGDVLAFNANIDVTADDVIADNNFDFNQTVVGSYDPNDITCLEGNALPLADIGTYLHYNIRFENTGTAPAENIVVTSEIDLTQYNIQSLQIMESSHPMEVKVTGNIAEFIFQTINLDMGGHGNILLKLKSNAAMTNNQVVNSADIFFDYNFPIETNDEQTVFADLSKDDFNKDLSIQIYPNPAAHIINVKADSTINAVQLFDAQGRLLLTKLINENTTEIDLSIYSSGIYFINVSTITGKQTQKIIKK